MKPRGEGCPLLAPGLPLVAPWCSGSPRSSGSHALRWGPWSPQGTSRCVRVLGCCSWSHQGETSDLWLFMCASLLGETLRDLQCAALLGQSRGHVVSFLHPARGCSLLSFHFSLVKDRIKNSREMPYIKNRCI